MARAKKSFASKLFGVVVFIILLIVMINMCSSDTEEPEPVVVTTPEPEPVVVVTTVVSEEPTSVSNNAPTASFTATPTSGQAPLVVSFNASGSSDSDGSITSYAWSFGDRGSLSGSTASHTYSNTYSGTRTYMAELTVTDNDGATDTAFRTIQVSATPPEEAEEPESTQDTLGGSVGETVEAWVIAQKFVKDKLVSPSTAKFRGYASSPYVVYLGDRRYRVTASVDSQNSFGAMLRTEFVAIVRAERDEHQTWILESLEF